MASEQAIRAGVLGATGYTGIELVRLLLQHPNVDVTILTSERFADRHYSDVFPAFRDCCDLKLSQLKSKDVARQTTFVFSCLPHQQSMPHIPTLLELGSKVVDLSADFRLDSVSTFNEWYGDHTAPQLLQEKVYGLPEVYRKQISQSFLVANPGCYPTATLLGLLPLLQEKLIATDSIIIDAKSGVSGAGRNPKQDNVFSERDESFKAYGVERHRHTPEIEQELSKFASQDLKVRFTPHLVPMDRGLQATIYAKPLKQLSSADLIGLYQKFYQREPFVRILPEDQLPDTKHVRGSNFCDITLRYDARTECITVFSALDNLNKGAAGQAIQNMNLMCGLDETAGLMGTALIP